MTVSFKCGRTLIKPEHEPTHQDFCSHWHRFATYIFLLPSLSVFLTIVLSYDYYDLGEVSLDISARSMSDEFLNFFLSNLFFATIILWFCFFSIFFLLQPVRRDVISGEVFSEVHVQWVFFFCFLLNRFLLHESKSKNTFLLYRSKSGDLIKKRTCLDTGSGDLILEVAQYSQTRIQTNPTDNNIYMSNSDPLVSEMKSRGYTSSCNWSK
jgi:hypothetical protein